MVSLLGLQRAFPSVDVAEAFRGGEIGERAMVALALHRALETQGRT